ncbi:hypothetical protein TELCIR_01448 [Teladorsagia circumcincta]|uniref:RCR-type E3 ubiquitin transferase n=1 Tax=Teladorsagia circumcincta TaxID=45464 RepID=A0A2G9V1V7_TELCI|nr:hypothetical protein TELCIR_01448 [Teladorsagia circumcincta]
MNKEPVHSILNSKRFWLSVAALALVRDRSWLALSEKWNDFRTPSQEQVTLCENHDDGSTPAQILFHGESLNGLVELPSDPFAALTSATNLAAGQSTSSLVGVCSHPDCVRFLATACRRNLPCGHPCGGIAGEKECLPCLVCSNEDAAQDGDDVCVVCFTDRLCAAPCVRLGCGHLLHYHCVRAVLEKRWPGPRIQFRFMNCPLCNVQMSHSGLADLLEPLLALKAEVTQKANMRLEFDGLLGCTALTDPQSEYFGRPEEYAVDRYMYVLCNVCQKAYFGGESRCQMALQSFQCNAAELVCGGCSAPAACHEDFQRLVCLPRNQFPPCPTGPRATPGEGPCPLRRPHPPAGEEFALGCAVAFPHGPEIEASGAETGFIDVSFSESSLTETSLTETSLSEASDLDFPTASSLDEAIAALKEELEGSATEPSAVTLIVSTGATTVRQPSSCKIFDICHSNEDCPAGACLGTFVGRCSCQGCRNFYSCKTDDDCGGLKGSCSERKVCDCNEGFKKAGFPSFFDALTKFCNQKTCTARTADEDCFGLKCNSGRCIC